MNIDDILNDIDLDIGTTKRMDCPSCKGKNTFTITNKTTTGFQIAFTNSSSSGVSRTFDYIAKGF